MKRLYIKPNPVKQLIVSKKTLKGRNNMGRISNWHAGGSKYKRLYRILESNTLIKQFPAIVRRIEYDPNRNTFISLICFVTGILTYIIAYAGIKCGDIIYNNINTLYQQTIYTFGSKNLLYKYTPRFNFYSFGTQSTKHTIARASGAYAIMLKNFSWFYNITRLPSKEERYILQNNNFGTSGKVLHNSWLFKNKFKAGRIRNYNKRPVVRGVAMNPIDHPHGGGEGRTKGHIPKSPWGWLTKDIRKRKRSKFVIKRYNWMK